MDGTVVAIVTEEGTTVNSLQQAPTIVKLARLDVMQVKAQISEADVTKVKVGQTVYFTILGDQTKKYYARLATVEPAPESIKTSDSVTSSSSSTATAIYYNGLFNVPNTDGKLRTSMTAQVYIVLADAKNVLTIPSSALTGDMVRVMTKNGKIEPRRVRIGVNNNVQAEVLSGLAEGDQVVVAEATGQAAPPSARNQRIAQRAGGGMGGLGGMGGGLGGGRPPGGGPPGGGPPGGGPPGGGGGPPGGGGPGGPQ
jgi:macrolide-specific efflux system membrane fusion protein